MKKEINLVSYDSQWKNIFNKESKILKETLRQNCTKIYHIGSTSVPGLCAKPKVDIMCVVVNLKETILPLENIGYKYKGEFNVPMKFFFSKRTPYSINLHILTSDNGELPWNLTFQNYLRKNNEARELYANTKIKLVNNNSDGFNMIPNMFSCYTSAKGDIIHKIAKEAGFKGERFVIATNPNEINTYNDLIGNVNSKVINNSDIFKLVLYRDMDIVAVSCVELKSKNLYHIKSVNGINNDCKNRIIAKIQEWMDLHGKSQVQKIC